MPESVNGGNQKATNPPKEMSMEIRLLIAFLLMGAVMFLTPYFFKTPAPTPAKKSTEQTPAVTQNDATKNGAATATVTPAAEAAEPSPAKPSTPATTQQALPPLIIDTDFFHIAFSNQGAGVP